MNEKGRDRVNTETWWSREASLRNCPPYEPEEGMEDSCVGILGKTALDRSVKAGAGKGGKMCSTRALPAFGFESSSTERAIWGRGTVGSAMLRTEGKKGKMQKDQYRARGTIQERVQC